MLLAFGADVTRAVICGHGWHASDLAGLGELLGQDPELAVGLRAGAAEDLERGYLADLD
jgi:hypothetical protein